MPANPTPAEHIPPHPALLDLVLELPLFLGHGCQPFVFEEIARHEILRGVKAPACGVKLNLGPRGRNVATQKGSCTASMADMWRAIKCRIIDISDASSNSQARSSRLGIAY